MDASAKPVRGRGAASNPPNRFERLHYERDADWNEPDDPAPRTQFLKDSTRTIIATNHSPDIPFEASINPYRGCEHGCMSTCNVPTMKTGILLGKAAAIIEKANVQRNCI